MIIVRITGGLGNQLFRYAFARCLAIKHQTEVKLDLFDFEKDNFRDYELQHFSIQASNALKKDLPYKRRRDLNKYLAHILDLLVPGPTIKYEENFHFITEVEDYPDNIYLDGYWQSFKYFNSIKNIIKTEFQVKSDLNFNAQKLLQEIRGNQSIAIHIRRGDYVNHPIHPTCSLQYYLKAIEIISQKITNPIIYIFSDDIEWVKKNLTLSLDHHYLEANKSWEDFKLMTECKHFIISNSTFSWWAAYLSSGDEKIVIAPEKWFNRTGKYVNYTTSDLLPETWIKLNI